MNRRKIQNTNRAANKFNLQPMPGSKTERAALAERDRQYAAAYDLECATMLEEPAPTQQEQQSGRITVKPKNWPWNKHLPCCGQREKECECGAERFYGWEGAGL